MIEKVDFYAELSKNLNDVKSEVKNKWEEIWKNRTIHFKEKTKEFENYFKEKILPEMLEMHRIEFYTNNFNKREFIYYQIFKILKLFGCNLSYLSEYVKTLEKTYKNKKYIPKIPTNLDKTYYIEMFRKNIYNVNLLEDIKNYGITDSILSTCGVILDFKEMNIPSYSTYIQITFTLKKPYLSKDDENFYVIDNPIVKDKVFKLPIVRSTTWKGALRFAAIKVFEDWVYDNLSKSGKIDKETVFKERLKIVRLFGNEKGNHEEYLGRICVHAIEGKLSKDKEELKEKVKSINEEFKKWLIKNGWISKEVPSRSGRLFFYPTFFDRISLDVITPLSREKKTPVRGPIYFEIVPESTTGILRILYYPFDLIARGVVEKIEEELKEDMELLGRALKKMFTETGFSVKKTSGFGVVSEFNGKVTIPFKKIENVEFKSFDELSFSKLCTKVNKNVNSGVSK